MSLVSRARSFVDRVHWMAPYSGGHLAASRALVQFKTDRKRAYPLQFGGVPFYCRSADLQAVREVLVDQEYAFLAPLLSRIERPRLLDVGAHIGTFGMWALSIVPGASILSVEADPDTYVITCKNAAARGDQWTVVNRAASVGENGTVRFAQDGPSMSHRVVPTGGIEIETIGLGGLLERMDGAVDLLKVDIEGSEEDFLAVSPNLLDQVGAAVVELHPQLCDTDRVRRVLSERYSSVEEVSGRTSSKPLLYAY